MQKNILRSLALLYLASIQVNAEPEEDKTQSEAQQVDDQGLGDELVEQPVYTMTQDVNIVSVEARNLLDNGTFVELEIQTGHEWSWPMFLPNVDQLKLNISVMLWMTDPHWSDFGQKRQFLLELARQWGTEDKPIYERLVFSYTEKEEAAAVTVAETVTGSSDEVSLWGDFFFHRSNKPIPPITDHTAEPSEATLVVEQQISPFTGSLPIGNYIPYVSKAKDWHLKANLDQDLSRRGKVDFVAEMKAEEVLKAPDLGSYEKQKYNMRIVVINQDELDVSEVDYNDPKMFTMFDLGELELDFSHQFVTPSFSSGQFSFVTGTLISALLISIF